MDSWVWVLFGFIAGLVVFAMLYMIFHKDTTAELQQTVDDQGAQLSKAEMKTAVLQDKMLAAEFQRDELRAGQEAEQARRDEEWQSKLDAADAGYREKLAVLEKHFTDLDVAFAAQLAAEKEKKIAAAGIAAGLAASMVEGEAAADDEPSAESESEDVAVVQPDDEAEVFGTSMETGGQPEDVGAGPSTGPEEPDLVDATLLAAGVGAGAVLATGEDAEEEFEAADGEAESSEDAPAVGEETADDSETAVPVLDDETTVVAAPLTGPDEEDEPSAAAKAALAVGGAAAAAAVLSDDEDGEEETAVDEDTPDEALDDSAELAEEIEDLPADLPTLEDGAEPATEQDGEQTGADLGEEDFHAAMTASAVAGGAVAAVLAASDGEEEESAQTAGERIEEGEEAQDETGEESGDELGEDAVDGAEETVEEDTIEEEAEPIVPPWPEDTSTWQGEYFNNMKLEGDPVLTREDAEIDFDWGMEAPAPEVNKDGFSVRWTRTADLPPGLYRFTVTSDDGSRLFVDGRMVVSAWYDHTEMTFRRELELPGGPLDLRVEYYENVMAALIRVSWERIG